MGQCLSHSKSVVNNDTSGMGGRVSENFFPRDPPIQQHSSFSADAFRMGPYLNNREPAVQWLTPTDRDAYMLLIQ